MPWAGTLGVAFVCLDYACFHAREHPLKHRLCSAGIGRNLLAIIVTLLQCVLILYCEDLEVPERNLFLSCAFGMAQNGIDRLFLRVWCIWVPLSGDFGQFPKGRLMYGLDIVTGYDDRMLFTGTALSICQCQIKGGCKWGLARKAVRNDC